jgi:2-C-methyl-D-erythritol 4-phosphate cytidylyltransferase/2-C-methyl-D-erythritol 2,4-cyclodiphosphate synthase
MHVAAILAAGGLGTRIGGGVPKQFHDLGDGTLMISRSLETLMACALVDEVVVALPSGFGLGYDRPAKPLTIAAAGARRQDSVANALGRVSEAADLIVIHDAARPFVSLALLERTIRAAHAHGAAIAALPVHDTVKQAGDVSGDTRTIRATLPRETIFLAQTPQAFRRDLLADAMVAVGETSVTDESMLVERTGQAVHLVEGDAANIKITTPDDLAWARARLRGGDVADPVTRVGTGYDLHRLVEGRPLILAGVRVPFDRGLLGHSDADIVCHAVTDAVLGAAGLGDIGRLFPDSLPQWKDADSLELLRRARRAVVAAGLLVGNVDVTVIAERPTLLPHIEAMRANLAAALGVGAAAVSVKGKTNEGVDATGRGEAMACHAVALLVRDRGQ